MELPFNEIESGENTFIRCFKSDLDSGDLHWHRDRESRIIESIEETNWMFQIDDQLPIPIKGIIHIPKGVYHRLIKGDGDLTIKLIKLKD